jgi:hypothetical protein
MKNKKDKPLTGDAFYADIQRRADEIKASVSNLQNGSAQPLTTPEETSAGMSQDAAEREAMRLERTTGRLQDVTAVDKFDLDKGFTVHPPVSPDTNNNGDSSHASRFNRSGVVERIVAAQERDTGKENSR